MMPDSFTVNGVDMRAEWGLMVVARDFLLPELRPRKVVIPTRDGAYDYGARHYEERELRIECSALGTRKTREELRELAFALSAKCRVALWDEPGKYYVGRVYKPVNLDYIRMVGHTFTLVFACEPFAYGGTFDGPLPERIRYAGTARTPARLTITNTSGKTIHGLRMTMREKRG